MCSWHTPTVDTRILTVAALLGLTSACGADEVPSSNGETGEETGEETGGESGEPLDCESVPERLDTPGDGWAYTWGAVTFRPAAMLPGGDVVGGEGGKVARYGADGTLRWTVSATGAAGYMDTSTSGAILGVAWSSHAVDRLSPEGVVERSRTLDEDPDGVLLGAAIGPADEVLLGYRVEAANDGAGGWRVRHLDAELETTFVLEGDERPWSFGLAVDDDGVTHIAVLYVEGVIEDYDYKPALLAFAIEISAWDPAGEPLWSTDVEFPANNANGLQLELGDHLYLAAEVDPQYEPFTTYVWSLDGDGQLRWSLEPDELDAVAASPCGGLYAAAVNTDGEAWTWRIDAEGGSTEPVALVVPSVEGIPFDMISDLYTTAAGDVAAVGFSDDDPESVGGLEWIQHYRY